MDINSLLSPQESPVSDAALRSPTKQPGLGPHAQSPRLQQLHTSVPSNVRNVKFTGSPLVGSSPATTAMPSPPPSDFPHRPQRQSSGMDTLADLASMQHHQQLARANASGLKNPEPYETQLSSANIRPSLQAIARTHSGSKSSLDIRMSNAPTQTPPPRVFTAPSLTDPELQRVSELVDHLNENSHAYDSHVQLIKLLYHGFLSHVFPATRSLQENEPGSYALLGDLKQAIEAMSTRFSLGEELWEVRLQVALLAASSLDDCMALLETFEKAITEEQTSTKLWALYGEWYLSLYSAGNPSDSGAAELSKPLGLLSKLSDEDKMVMSEVFSRVDMMKVWRRAADNTRYRIDESHTVWDKYLDLRLAALKTSHGPGEVAAVKLEFFDRLAMPHSTWQDTSQRFSTFTSTYENAEYEETMVAVSKHGSKAKAQYAERETFELELKEAVAASDPAAEWNLFSEYLAWELSRSRKKKLFNYELTNALYLRSLLRFPAVVDAWEDYLSFLADEGARGRETVSQLSVLDRACNHCSWSGNLWSQYILAAELEDSPFADMSQIKHKATSTGLLDSGGMEEILKIHNAWCGCLKRRAFQRDSTDDELDVAEVAIRSAIEDVETLGKTKYGAEYTGDPQYRLERIYIKFLTQNRNFKGARDTWKQLAKRHKSSYQFWLQYHAWEMFVWAASLASEGQSASHQAPSEATIVLRQAVEQQEMDWPEKIIETYLSHCEDHENAAEIQTAIFMCRKATKEIQQRRNAESLEAARLAQEQNVQADVQAPDIAKRKRGPEDGQSGNKKARTGEAQFLQEPSDQQDPEDSLPKRDRENATVIVKNLPVEITEKRIRHFFNDCGTISTINMLNEGSSVTATLEFESKEDALAAQTKDQKILEENVIIVQLGTSTTLYVTNFPPTADEAFIKDLFSKYGTILDVRFPSLKYDTHRRFCYVQFKKPNEARAAMELDGTNLGKNFQLLVKISDPTQKQTRQGPVHEGREVYISNVNWNANEDAVKQLFSKYGNVEKVRIPRQVNGKSKGIAFVVFSSKDEATAALVLDQSDFQSRQLHVELSTANPTKRQATTIVARSVSPSVSSQRPQDTPKAGYNARPSREEIESRTVVLLNVPDTVNDTRIKELMQKHGDLVKVTLRPDHQGAVVEYKDVKAAGKASLEIEGYELAPGRKLRVGTFEELKHENEEVRGEEKEPAKPQLSQSSAPIRRPGQRGGRRGGLGFKKSDVPSAGPLGQGKGFTVASKDPTGPNDRSTTRAKSNADFKAMFTK